MVKWILGLFQDKRVGVRNAIILGTTTIIAAIIGGFFLLFNTLILKEGNSGTQLEIGYEIALRMTRFETELQFLKSRILTLEEENKKRESDLNLTQQERDQYKSLYEQLRAQYDAETKQFKLATREGKGYFRILGWEPGIKVFLDDEEIRDFAGQHAPGVFNLRIEKQGFHSYIAPIEILSDQLTEIRIKRVEG